MVGFRKGGEYKLVFMISMASDLKESIIVKGGNSYEEIKSHR
jgi:hypothetical protein